MAVDPQLSIQAGNAQPNIGGVVNNAVQMENSDALAAEQILKAHRENMSARDQSRLRSTVVGAAQLKTYLDKNDLDGAHDFLTKRQTQIQQRMANGEDIDDDETAYALDKIRRGDLQGLQTEVAAVMAAGQAYGMIGGVDGTPSSVREWQYYNSLSETDQKRWRDQKRAGSNIDLGDKVIRLDAAGKPEQSYTKDLAPADQPTNAADKAKAVAEGTAAGEAGVNVKKLDFLVKSLNDLKTTSNAPGGTLQNLGASVANKSGIGGEAAVAQGDYVTKRAAAENAIREAFRVAGSGANSDRDAAPFIEMLPVASDSVDVRAAKIDAALAAVQNKISSQMQVQGMAGGGGTAPGGDPNEIIKVVNPKTGEKNAVKRSRLADAQAEGFQPE